MGQQLRRYGDTVQEARKLWSHYTDWESRCRRRGGPPKARRPGPSNAEPKSRPLPWYTGSPSSMADGMSAPIWIEMQIMKCVLPWTRLGPGEGLMPSTGRGRIVAD